MADVKPRIRLDKKTARAGEVIEVKTLVSHVMESGQRRDSAGAVVPRKRPRGRPRRPRDAARPSLRGRGRTLAG